MSGRGSIAESFDARDLGSCPHIGGRIGIRPKTKRPFCAARKRPRSAGPGRRSSPTKSYNPVEMAHRTARGVGDKGWWSAFSEQSARSSQERVARSGGPKPFRCVRRSGRWNATPRSSGSSTPRDPVHDPRGRARRGAQLLGAASSRAARASRSASADRAASTHQRSSALRSASAFSVARRIRGSFECRPSVSTRSARGSR